MSLNRKGEVPSGFLLGSSLKTKKRLSNIEKSVLHLIYIMTVNDDSRVFRFIATDEKSFIMLILWEMEERRGAKLCSIVSNFQKTLNLRDQYIKFYYRNLLLFEMG